MPIFRAYQKPIMLRKIIPVLLLANLLCIISYAQQRPNIIIFYTDDLGYGDISCYGATQISTPYIDKLAGNGLRFTNGHSVAATCTPSRYALITGEYPWRKKGTNILPGNATLIIPRDRTTLPGMLRKAGYTTGIVGKWHLGLGDAVDKNWNGDLRPGPNEVGFDYSFILPATADRVPTVFVEDGQVAGLDPNDPIMVSYDKPIGNDPTGKEHPELLKMRASKGQGHDQTIINGIGRIGYMTGGKTARWTDEELPFTFLEKAKHFIASNKNKPFFLYYPMTEPHVPRMPATMFKGKSKLGPRGDVILQMDWTIGAMMTYLKELGISDNTLVIFTSDNGPVLDDGYEDGAVSMLNGHTPAGKLRGGKYSAFEAGTRVPFIVSWPARIKPGVSDALVCQIDFLSSFAGLVKTPLDHQDAPDSQNMLDVLTGKDKTGRKSLVRQGAAISIVENNWKYIEPSGGPALLEGVNIESGSAPAPQLYHLTEDIGEKNNQAARFPDKVNTLKVLLEKIRKDGRSR